MSGIIVPNKNKENKKETYLIKEDIRILIHEIDFLKKENEKLKKEVHLQLLNRELEYKIKKIIYENIDKNKDMMEDKDFYTCLSYFKDFDDKINLVRHTRDKLLEKTIWIKERHECELKEKQIGLSSGTSLSQAKYEEWLSYWKELRNLPNKIINGEMDIKDIIFPKEPTK
jgi:hypothetical protein